MKSKLLILPALFALSLLSCTKNDSQVSDSTGNQLQQVVVPDDSATYKMYITGTWKNPEHSIPAYDHFTPFIGAVHNSSSKIFELGKQASKGVEDFAEEGNALMLNHELDSLTNGNKLLKRLNLYLRTITSIDSVTFTTSKNFAQVSFISMIAPSPDWFTGINSFALINKDWVKDTTIAGFGYDAGTEDGDVFGYNNPATVPQQPIIQLSPANASVIANGNTVIAPFIKVRFVRMK